MFKYPFKKGFTLIELLVVVIILGLLASFALPSYMTSLETTRAREAIVFARQWQAGRAIYFAENEAYPTNNRSLQAIGLDPLPAYGPIEGDFKLSPYFTLDLRTYANTAALVSTKQDNGEAAIRIMATDTTLDCCAKTARYQKVCATLSSLQTSQETTFGNSTYNCYSLGESD